MVTQFTPVQPGWVVQFRCESTDPEAPEQYTITAAVVAWVFVPGDAEGWEADPVVWAGGEPWDAQAYADHLGAKSYHVVPA